MDWPAQSPDLNPFENAWATLRRDCEHMIHTHLIQVNYSMSFNRSGTLYQMLVFKGVASMPTRAIIVKRILQCLKLIKISDGTVRNLSSSIQQASLFATNILQISKDYFRLWLNKGYKTFATYIILFDDGNSHCINLI